MAVDLAALKTELLTTNPATYAANIAIGAMGKVAEQLNAVQATIKIGRSDVRPQDVLEAIDLSDMSNSTAVNAGAGKTISETWLGSWFESVMQVPSLQLRRPNAQNTGLVDTRVMSNIKLLLTNAAPSETRLRTVGQRDGSRAEQLFGENAAVTANDVQGALVLP